MPNSKLTHNGGNGTKAMCKDEKFRYVYKY